MFVKEEQLFILRKKGLSVVQFFPKNHAVYPNGYSISKPIEVIGNSLPNYKVKVGSGSEITDAPCSVLFIKKNKYVFTVQQYFPEPGPGDFKKTYDTVEEAIEAILEYYFGQSKEFAEALAAVSNKKSKCS